MKELEKGDASGNVAIPILFLFADKCSNTKHIFYLNVYFPGLFDHNYLFRIPHSAGAAKCMQNAHVNGQINPGGDSRIVSQTAASVYVTSSANNCIPFFALKITSINHASFQQYLLAC